jgi:hypothetical protein
MKLLGVLVLLLFLMCSSLVSCGSVGGALAYLKGVFGKAKK